MNLRGRAIAAVLLTVGLSASVWAETVLVPAQFFQRPGANGAVWSTELAILNTSDQDFGLFPSMCSSSGVLVLGARSQHKNVLTCFSEEFGILLTVPDEVASEVFFELRVRDVNSTTSFGAAIPVVRESHRLHGRTAIADFPNKPAFRKTLRFVNLSKTQALTGRIRAYAVGLYDRLQSIGEVGISVPPSSHALFPNGVVMNEATGLPSAPPNQLMEYEFAPDDPSQEYWWWGSVASEETNEVTVSVPQ
jgi:hypothetical protein